MEDVLLRHRTVSTDYFLFEYLEYALTFLSRPVHDMKNGWPHFLKWASTLLFYGIVKAYDAIRGEGWSKWPYPWQGMLQCLQRGHFAQRLQDPSFSRFGLEPARVNCFKALPMIKQTPITRLVACWF